MEDYNVLEYKRHIIFEGDFNEDLDFDSDNLVDDINDIIDTSLSEFKEDHKEDYAVNFNILDILEVSVDFDFMYLKIKTNGIVDTNNVNEVFNDILSEMDLSADVNVYGEQEVDSWDPTTDYGYVNSVEYVDSEGTVSVKFDETNCSLV